MTLELRLIERDLLPSIVHHLAQRGEELVEVVIDALAC